MSKPLDEIIEELHNFVAERDWQQFHNPKNLAMALVSEAGELAAEYRWIDGADADAWSGNVKNRATVSAEAADVAIALLLFCDRIGVDLIDAVRAKLIVNAKNYPVGFSRGKPFRPTV